MRPRSVDSTSRVEKAEAIDQIVQMLARASEANRSLTSTAVMTHFNVSKPTALAWLRIAKARLAAASVAPAVVERAAPEEDTEVAPVVHDVGRAQAASTGIDMAGTLSKTANHLERLRAQLEADLTQVRYWTMANADGELPGHCATCSAAIAKRVHQAPTPALAGKLDIGGLGRLYDSLVKTHRTIVDVVGQQNAVLEQFYNYRALQLFMAHVEQAVKEVAPAQAKAIAKRIRQLGERS